MSSDSSFDINEAYHDTSHDYGDGRLLGSDPYAFGPLADRTVQSELDDVSEADSVSRDISQVAAEKMSELLKDRDGEWKSVAERKRPLQLLDLPIDVLKEIVKEVCSSLIESAHFSAKQLFSRRLLIRTI